MIPEIEEFLNEIATSLGIKRVAISFVVDHLGYAVKVGCIRHQIKSLDVKAAVDGLKKMEELTRDLRRLTPSISYAIDDQPRYMNRSEHGT